MSEKQRAEDHDHRYQWSAMGQKDELTFAFVVVSRTTGRQRLAIIQRANDGKAAIVELGRWSIERPKKPPGFRAMFSKPPPIMAAERLRIYGVEGTQAVG